MSVTADRPAHFPALDGLRGVAAAGILLYHVLTPLAAGTAFARPLSFGWSFVDLFFVLSGFLITGILYDSLGSGGYFRTFYGRRALRIFPLYYGFVAVLWLVSPFFGHGERFANYALPLLTYTTNMPWGIEQPLDVGHLWSLAIEEQYYLLFPAVVFLVRDRVRLMQVCAGMMVAAVVWRPLAPTPFLAFAQLPGRMDALALGGLLALWSRGPQGFAPALQLARRAILPVGAAVVLVAAMSTSYPVHFDPWQTSVGLTLWALFYGCVLVLVLRGSRVLESAPLRYSGKVSYAVYLFHMPIIFAMRAFGMDPATWAFAAVAVALTFALAALSWRVYEAPILRLKRHFNYGPRVSRTAATVARVAA